eukprot:CAMPEP_0181182394 /NCGR_PEP_ID=MMETSP1096-20121128/7868_1 /TAXON_ID=156174 ORGANISM="Chrysochromulina ericina, Strain CCMP281" /NCGR_SAMPLE_ID=MMETSP1096 /ASSEMBLY_ACC=CAM_ASM_000453 /LENGTH=128 /DNA_ID=CAMNT_0023271003 /DNA_START=150 /DNA_END=533 /DNA_ORIENTATION=+
MARVAVPADGCLCPLPHEDAGAIARLSAWRAVLRLPKVRVPLLGPGAGLSAIGAAAPAVAQQCIRAAREQELSGVVGEALLRDALAPMRDGEHLQPTPRSRLCHTARAQALRARHDTHPGQTLHPAPV